MELFYTLIFFVMIPKVFRLNIKAKLPKIKSINENVYPVDTDSDIYEESAPSLSKNNNWI